jgi:hypothetical protein
MLAARLTHSRSKQSPVRYGTVVLDFFFEFNFSFHSGFRCNFLLIRSQYASRLNSCCNICTLFTLCQ